jgi:hypothetical protein
MKCLHTSIVCFLWSLYIAHINDFPAFIIYFSWSLQKRWTEVSLYLQCYTITAVMHTTVHPQCRRAVQTAIHKTGVYCSCYFSCQVLALCYIYNLRNNVYVVCSFNFNVGLQSMTITLNVLSSVNASESDICSHNIFDAKLYNYHIL